MFGKLYTNNFSNINKSKGVVISIARFNPKWLSPNKVNYWLSELAPSVSLLNDYKYHNLSKEDYVKRFENEMKSDKSRKALNFIWSLLKKGNNVTLLCYEKKYDFCHRFLISDMFEILGIECMELS